MFDSGIMQYDGFTFAYNPHKLTLQKDKRITTYSLANARTVVQEMGYYPMVITGEGTLTGDDVMAQMVTLQNLLTGEGSRMLSLPDLTPMYCYFTELTIIGVAGPTMLTYQFRFVEDTEKSTTLTSTDSYLIATAGDTVATVAAKCGVTVEELVAQNPALDGVVDITEGTILWLS